jgi:hypothetical protein
VITTPALRRSVEAYVKGKRSLSLCRDLCNSTKHLVRANKSGEKPGFGSKSFGVQIGSGPTSISLKYQVEAARGAIDAFQLATNCIDDWDSFLKSNKLS